MRYIDSVENTIYDTDKMELISSIARGGNLTKIYKTVTNKCFAVQNVLLGGQKMYKLEEAETKELLAEYDIDAYVKLFNPKEGE